MTEREKVWFDIWQFDSMVENGGYWHYFDVSAGYDIKWLLNSLKKVGATRTCKEVLALCRAFPDGWPSASYDKRKKQMEEIHEEDFKLPKGLKNNEDLEALVWDYWTK